MQDDGEDRAATSAEGKSDSDLASSLPDGLRDDSINTDHGKDEGDDAEQPTQRRLDARPCHRARHELLQRLDFRDALIGIDLSYLFLDQGHEGEGIPRRAHHQRRQGEGLLIVRQEEAGLWLRLELAVPNVSHDADDLHLTRVPPGHPEAPSERLLVRKQPARGGRVEHGHVLRADMIPLVEVAAFQERDAHGLEVARRDDRNVTCGPLGARRLGLVGPVIPRARVGARHRQNADRPRGQDLRHRANPLQNLIHELRVIGALAHGQQQHARREDAFHTEAGLDGVESKEAANHESGAPEQGQGPSHFGNDHGSAYPPLRRRHRAAGLVKFSSHVRSVGLQGRGQTRQDTGPERHSGDEYQHRCIDADFLKPRQGDRRRQGQDQCSDSPVGERQPAKATDAGEQQALH